MLRHHRSELAGRHDLNDAAPRTHTLRRIIQDGEVSDHSGRAPWNPGCSDRNTGHGGQNSERCRCCCGHHRIGWCAAHSERWNVRHRFEVHNVGQRGSAHDARKRWHHHRTGCHTEATLKGCPHGYADRHLYSPLNRPKKPEKVAFSALPSSSSTPSEPSCNPLSSSASTSGATTATCGAITC